MIFQFIEGFVVADASIQFSQKNNPYLRFRVGSKRFKDATPQYKTVLVTNESILEHLQEIKKGQNVFVIGEVTEDSYEKDGETKTSETVQAVLVRKMPGYAKKGDS